MEAHTVRTMIALGTERFREAGIENPRLNAELLLVRILGKDRRFMYMNPFHPLEPEIIKKYRALLSERAGGEPLQYLTGCQEFMGLDFIVNPSVLIPRADTETVVEAVLRCLKGMHDLKGTKQYFDDGISAIVSDFKQDSGNPGCSSFKDGGGIDNAAVALELGTGSGAIAVSLAYYCPGLLLKAVDISAGALQVAKANALKHGVANRIEFIKGDLFTPFKGKGAAFDVIVSNPPYISEKEMKTLPWEVLREPREALYGGPDGLCYYKRIVAKAQQFLKERGLLALEIGYDMAEAVTDLISRTGVYAGLNVIKDLAGKDRVVTAVFNGDRCEQ